MRAALFLFLTGCELTVASACEDYSAALASCYTGGEEELTADEWAELKCSEDDLSDESAGWFRCLADAYWLGEEGECLSDGSEVYDAHQDCVDRYHPEDNAIEPAPAE